MHGRYGLPSVACKQRGAIQTEWRNEAGIDFLEFAAPRLKGRDGSPRLVLTSDEPTPDTTPTAAEAQQERSACPPSDEIILTKYGHSVFINMPLKSLLKVKGD
jgi:hypothetical protein